MARVLPLGERHLHRIAQLLPSPCRADDTCEADALRCQLRPRCHGSVSDTGLLDYTLDLRRVGDAAYKRIGGGTSSITGKLGTVNLPPSTLTYALASERGVFNPTDAREARVEATAHVHERRADVRAQERPCLPVELAVAQEARDTVRVIHRDAGDGAELVTTSRDECTRTLVDQDRSAPARLQGPHIQRDEQGLGDAGQLRVR